MLIINALSQNMLPQRGSTIQLEKLDGPKGALAALQVPGAGLGPGGAYLTGGGYQMESAVGHADTAAVISADLGITVPANRQTVALKPGDKALLAQYIGPRLAEGTTALPDGAKIEYYAVSVGSPGKLDRLSAVREAVIKHSQDLDLDSMLEDLCGILGIDIEGLVE